MAGARQAPSILALLAASFTALSGLTPARAMDDPTGVWTLSIPGAARSCRLQLRADPAATGQAVAVPPACRHAFPVLAPVRSWSVPDGIHVALNDENGANVLMFGEDDSGRLQAVAGEGATTYLLTPLKPRKKSAAAAPPPAAPAVAADPTPRPAAREPVTAAAAAGHYAVMRGARDTGCMVTLEAPVAAVPTFKARLAPACRDQGIIIFDPIGWSVKGDRIVLAARKGHTASFSQDEDGIWVKDPKSGQPLGLKRL